jgi:hypothetical protein
LASDTLIRAVATPRAILYWLTSLRTTIAIRRGRLGLQKLTINTQLAGWYVPMQIFVRPAKKVIAGLDLPSLAAHQENH